VYHQSGFAGGRSRCDPVFALAAQVGGATSPTFSFRNLDSRSISASEGTSSGVGMEFCVRFLSLGLRVGERHISLVYGKSCFRIEFQSFFARLGFRVSCTE
jgi:hypothetical protein